MDIEKYKQQPTSKLVNAFEEMIIGDEINFEFDIINNQGACLAYLTVIMWPLELSGFRIMQGSRPNYNGEYINLAPPSIKNNKGGYNATFWLHNPVLWFKFQNLAVKHYYEAKENCYSKTNEGELLNNDEIDKGIEKMRKENLSNSINTN